MILNDYSRVYLQCGKISDKGNDDINMELHLKPDVRLFEKKMSLLKIKHLNSHSNTNTNSNITNSNSNINMNNTNIITAPPSYNTKYNYKEPFHNNIQINSFETNVTNNNHNGNSNNNSHNSKQSYIQQIQFENETHHSSNKPSRNSQPHSSSHIINNDKIPPSLKTWNISTIKNINLTSIMNSYSSIHKNTKQNNTNINKRNIKHSKSSNKLYNNNRNTNTEYSSLKIIHKEFLINDPSFYEQFDLFYRQFQINESMLQQYLTLYICNYIDKITNKIKHNNNLLFLINLWEHIGTSYIIRKHYLDYLLSKPKHIIPLLIKKEINNIEQYKSKTNSIIDLIRLNEVQSTSNEHTVTQIKNEINKIKPLKVLWRNIDYELLLCYNEWKGQQCK